MTQSQFVAMMAGNPNILRVERYGIFSQGGVRIWFVGGQTVLIKIVGT